MALTSELNFESSLAGLSPGEAALWGFRLGDRGTHTSRTIMLDELSHLLSAVPEDAIRQDCSDAIMLHNCLGKRTTATRKLSLQRLTELYALDPQITLFRVLRDLWTLAGHEASRPLLALLLALARDPLLRVTATAVVNTPINSEFVRQPLRDALASAVGERLNEGTLDTVVRNISSSWTQSGHLQGRTRKTRQRVETTPVAAVFALLIGYATGRRGRFLFETPWTGILDTSPEDLIEVAVNAKRLGLLDLKQSGSIIDVSFPAFLASRVQE